MMAFTVHELELCSKCGYPREVCGSDAGFVAQKRVCNAAAVVEAAEEEAQKSKDPAHGVMWFPTREEHAPGGAAKPPPGMFTGAEAPA